MDDSRQILVDESRQILGSAIVRPVASVEGLIQAAQIIVSQFPSRRTSNMSELAELRNRYAKGRDLLLVAEVHGAIVGGALAHHAGDSVEVDVIALEPQARRLGIGRQLMLAIEREAFRLRAQAIYLGGATPENRGFYSSAQRRMNSLALGSSNAFSPTYRNWTPSSR